MFAPIISTAKIVKINHKTFHGTVYDLQTLSSLFIGNGVIVSNCRCTSIPVIEGLNDESTLEWRARRGLD